jgi:hypothetical protein
MNTTTTATTGKAQFTVNQVVPLRACFHWTGTKAYFLVRVSDGPHKGSPWVLATLEGDAFKFHSGWMRTEKAAYNEFKAAELETAYFLSAQDIPTTRTLTY